MTIDHHKHLLDEAMQLHKQGHLSEAKARYDAIVSDDAKHFTALHMLGVIACQEQRYDQGIEIIKRALIINPRSLSAHTNLINAFEKIGDNKSALIYAAQFVELEPSHQETIIKIVQLLQNIGLDEVSLLFLDKEIDVKKEAYLYVMKGNILLKCKNASEALTYFNQAILLNSHYVDAYANAGTALIMLNKTKEAVDYYNKALAIDSHHEAVIRNKALALQIEAGAQSAIIDSLNEVTLSIQQVIDQSEVLLALKQTQAAIKHIHKAIEVTPDNAALHNQQGLIYLAEKQYQAALNSFNKVLAIETNYIQAIINSALALMGLYQFEKAIKLCEKVLLIDSENSIAINNIGSALVELNRRNEALTQFKRAIGITPDAQYALLNASFCYLALGDYQNGLPLYEWRWQGDLLKSKFYIPRPMWSGQESLVGKTIFLYGEQGYGDSFQFARYIALVERLGANILLGVNDAIQPLFKRSFPYVELTDKTRPLPALDYYCPLGSLPLAFGTTIDTIPIDIPYLIADGKLVKKWQKKIPNKKPRIGIVWRGNPNNPVESKRALPVSLLMALANADVTLISLKIDVNEDEQLILDQHNVMCIDHQINDFDDTAAIIENLDLVISTDTSVAHLAGALGKPVWMLLAFSADWRWHLNRSDSPWYPSARLFRQPSMGDWDSVIKNVKKSVDEWIGKSGVI